MTAEPALFAEPGSTWWPVLWGPVFAAIGAGLESLGGGRVHVVAWLVVGAGLGGLAAGWAASRRRLLCVSLTATELRQGQETLAVQRIAEVPEGDPPARTRVLGGAWTVPRKFGEVPLRLDDGTVVLAWARDADGLRDALCGLVTSRGEVE
jgi:hypothetical protein